MGFLEERDMSNVPTIPGYFAGKTIFITGGSGFIGKILVEKLLYSCPNLERIYLLLRSKRGVNPDERLEQLYSAACFDRLRTERPGFFESKVYVISGDVMEPGLGISSEDRFLLINRTDIIFHVAASVRFDDPLKFAVKLNLLGTKQVVDLAKCIVNLSCLVHVSTSYSNTNMDVIEEVMYPPLADWRETIEVCDNLDDHVVRVMTKKYLGDLPNTYTFSKQLGEHVVYEQRGQLPAVIVRPSIVISSIEEPMPGWVENFNGPVGIFVACGKGIMRTIHTRPDIESDYIPVDICVKNIIASAWIRGTKKLEESDDIEIYNCCAGNLNRIDMKNLVAMAKRVGNEVPLKGMLWNAGGSVETSETIYFIKVLLQHLLPAVLVDIVLWILGKKPMLVKVQRRIYIANSALQYYLTKQWTFDNRNFIALRSALRNEDIKDFYYDLENTDVFDYFYKCCKGGKKYLLKESDEDEEKAKTHCKRMVLLDKLSQVIFYGMISWWVLKVSASYFNHSFGEFYIF